MGTPVQPGQIVNGKYRVERVLGEGGMGVVVAAYHLALDQRVAIKLLRPAMLAEPVAVERFAREARAASRIESDHVARVIDVGQLEDGTPFMVMEYLEGGDLSVVRRCGRGLPVPAAVGCVLEACEAIGEAHRRGIVHRDIKPSNLFLADRGDGRARVKVLDFGISKLDAGDRISPGVTKTVTVMGSPEYMSPEQMLSSRDVDARTDIWALGATLYELLTARVPFTGETVTQLYASAMSKPPPPPSAFRPDVPPGLDKVVLRCLENDRARRYGSVEELRAALTPYAAPDAVQPLAAWIRASEAGPVAPPGAPGPAYFPPAPAGTMSGTTSRVAGPWMTPARSIALGAGVVAVVGLGAIAIAWSYDSGVTRPAAASAAPSITASAEPRGAPPAPVPAPPVVGPAPSGAPVAGSAKDAPSASPAATKPTRAPAAAVVTKATVAPIPTAKPQKAGPTDTHSMD